MRSALIHCFVVFVLSAAIRPAGTAWAGLQSGSRWSHAEPVGLFFEPTGMSSTYSEGGHPALRGLSSHWSSPFPALNGDVMALLAVGDKLYAGGFFVSAGDVTVNYIAMWDGSRWSSLGSGMDQAVLALALDERGNLYAGGNFSTAGGEPAASVAMWDGEKWSSLGSGVNSVVYSLASGANGTMYVGGSFTQAGGAYAEGIAQWRDGRWDRVGGGMDHHVFAMVPTDDGRLYAAGGFMTAGGKMAHQVAVWDGKQWEPLGEGLNPAYAGRPALALALDADGRLYAGGSFTSAGDAETAHLARWDGHRWSSLGKGVDGGVRTLAFDAEGALYAGGYFTRAGEVSARHVAQWKDGKWTYLEGGTDKTVNALAVDENGMVHVGGSFDVAGSTPANRVACWRIALATKVEMPSQGSNVNVLEGAFPNPFDVSTTLSFTLSDPHHVTLKVFDGLGRERHTLISGIRSAGKHDVVLEASDLPSGVYFYVLDVGGGVQSGQVIVRH